MAIAIRGSTPAVSAVTGALSVTLTGTRQPQAGDVLLIIHGNDFYALSNMSTPTVGGSTTGVTAVTGGSGDAGSNLAHNKSYTYVVGSTGDLTVAAVETGAADEDKMLAVYVLSGVDTTTPVDVAGSNEDHSFSGTTSRIAPSVSPSSSNAFLIVHTNDGGGSVSGPYTPPSGMSETYDGNATGGMGYSGAVVQLSASGATGTKVFTVPNTTTSYAALSIAMKTASGGGAPAFPPRVISQYSGMF